MKRVHELRDLSITARLSTSELESFELGRLRNYPRTERGGSRELYWPASTSTRTSQPPFWRDAAVLGRPSMH